ncbi:MAG: Uma2 family endonuclease [Planctomycetaceae bacterium]
MSAGSKIKLTAAEYLSKERRAEFRSEFYRGEMFAMAGNCREHCLIVGNLASVLGAQFKGRCCEVYSTNMRIKVSASELYTYPDVVVVCEKPEFQDTERDTLLNPTVLIEVLSRSTESYDRGAKSEQYRRIPSLREHLLIAQDRPHVEVLIRQANQNWLLQETSDLEQTVTIPSLSVSLSMREIYDRITFDESSLIASRAASSTEVYP